jgi:hypothetical protein
MTVVGDDSSRPVDVASVTTKGFSTTILARGGVDTGIVGDSRWTTACELTRRPRFCEGISWRASSSPSVDVFEVTSRSWETTSTRVLAVEIAEGSR